MAKIHIISWNIQTITAKRAADHSGRIANHVMEITKNFKEKFILFILENKTNPDKILDTLKNAIKGKYHYRVRNNGNIFTGQTSMGGSRYAENLLVIYSEGIDGLRLRCFKKWQSLFDVEYKRSYAQRKIDAEADEKRKNDLHDFRNPQGKRERKNEYERDFNPSPTKKQWVENTPPAGASELRNPVIATFKFGTARLKVMVLHAPGPRLGEFAQEVPYAATYAETVLSSAGRYADFVIGDFNVYSDIKPGAFKLCGSKKNTTYGARVSFLDRVYAASAYCSKTRYWVPGFEAKVKTGLVGKTSSKNNPNPCVSDHSCIDAEVDL